MLELTPVNILRLSDHAKGKTKQYTHDFKKIAKRRSGPHYLGHDGEEQPFRKNYYHRWITYAKPQICGGTPRARVETPHLGEQGEDAKLIELALNRWTIDTDFQAFLYDGPADDIHYNMGVVMVSSEPLAGARPIEGVGTDLSPNDPKFKETANIPWTAKCYRIPQERYFQDDVAMQADEVRFQGHDFARDWTDIEKEGEEGGWNMDLIGKHASDAELSLLGRDHSDTSKETARKEIVLREVWVPEADPTEEQLEEWGVEKSPGPEDGFHGWVFTLLASSLVSGEAPPSDERRDQQRVRSASEEGWARKPRPYYGPPQGPYVLFGVNVVKNQALPLGPLQAMEEEIRQANTDANVAANMIREYKRTFGIVGGASPQDVQYVKDGQHGGFYLLKGISDKGDIIPLELGGLTEQVASHVAWNDRIVEEGLGLSEIDSGAAPRPGKTTATADAMAGAAGAARFYGVEYGFNRGVEAIYSRVAWYFWSDNRQSMMLGPDAANELGFTPTENPFTGETVEPEVRFYGGNRSGESRPPYESLSVKLEAYSMRRTTEDMQQRRALQQLNMVTALVPMAAMYPTFPWADFAENLGEAMNWPGFGKLFSDTKSLAMDAQAMAMGPAMAGNPAPGGGAPPPPGSAGGRGLPGNVTGANLAAVATS